MTIVEINAFLINVLNDSNILSSVGDQRPVGRDRDQVATQKCFLGRLIWVATYFGLDPKFFKVATEIGRVLKNFRVAIEFGRDPKFF